MTALYKLTFDVWPRIRG